MRRLIGLVLVAAGTVHGVLIPFTTRAQFAASTTQAAGLPVSGNGVDFSDPSLCPATPVAGCTSGVQTYGSTGTGSTPATLTFSSITGFSIQGFSLGSSGQTRISLYATGFDHSLWLPMTYAVPVLSTRNTFDYASNISTMKIRVNMPANVNSFALDLSNGCNTNTNQSGANDCGPEDNHFGTILVTAKRVGQAIVASDTAVVSTVDALATGELTFFGARSDAEDIEYIDLTLPLFSDSPTNGVANVGSIIATRIAFGQAQAPEPSTFLLAAAGLALLLRRRKR